MSSLPSSRESFTVLFVGRPSLTCVVSAMSSFFVLHSSIHRTRERSRSSHRRLRFTNEGSSLPLKDPVYLPGILAQSASFHGFALLRSDYGLSSCARSLGVKLRNSDPLRPPTRGQGVPSIARGILVVAFDTESSYPYGSLKFLRLHTRLPPFPHPAVFG